MLSHDSRKAVARRIFLPQQQIFPQQLLLLRGARHEQIQMFEIDRLLNKIKGSVFHGRHRLFDGAEGGDQNDRNGRVGLLGLVKHLETRTPGQLEIAEHQQIASRADLVDRRRTVGSFVHGVPGALQRLAQHGAQFGLVFN